MVNTVLRREDVERVTGLPRSTIYDMMSKGTFPKPIRLGARSVGWIESEIAQWLQSRLEARDRAMEAA